VLFAVGMYGVAETLANLVPKPEEYIARLPGIAIVPWFLAGRALPDHSPPRLPDVVRQVPAADHALALMRYGLLGDGSGLHAIWRMGDTGAMAALSLGVVALFALALTAISLRVFARSAVR
jgi:hypothetical protein